jgi:O-antigen/teichoic acid export membrane protein
MRKLASRFRGLGGLQDLSTLSPEGRSRERHKRLALTAATSVGLQSTSIIVGFITLPLTLRYLGTERYGLWVTITSFTSLLVFADLGLGQGLVNGISSAEGKDQRSTATHLVASAFYMLVLVAAVLGGVFAALYPVVPWDEVFNVRTASASAVAGPAVAVLVAMTLVGIPFGLVIRIRQGFQESFIANFWMAVGSVVSLAALVIVISLGGDLPWLVFAFMWGPVAASFLNIASMLRARPWLLPRPRHVTLSRGRQLLSLGLLFFIVQVAGVVGYQTDNIVIARIVDAAAVTQFAVPMRLFMLIPAVAGFIVYPLWPAYREALARGDHRWFRRTVRWSLVLSAGTGVGLSVFLALIATPVIHVWAGRNVTPSASLVIALGAYSTLFTVSTAVAMFLYAVEAVGFLAASSVVFVILNLGFSIALTRTIGVPGPAWGSVIAMAPTLVAQLIYVRWRMSRLPSEGPS